MNDSPRLAQLMGFLSANPNDEFLSFALAKEHEKLGNTDLAFSFFNKLVENSPDYVGTYYHLGKMHLKSGNLEMAIATYKKGMEVASKLNDRHAYSELAGAKLEISDED